MISPSHVFHEDLFYEYFKPYRHSQAHHDVWGGHGLETFGDDLEIVYGQDPVYLWTVIDGDSTPDQWIVSGFHYVNRVCYLITEKPHNSIHMEFRVGRRTHSLTKLGMERQATRMRKLLADK